MLYYLLPPLACSFGALNVTRYITFRTAAASLTALVISLVLGPWLIRKLREFQVGQVIRQEGPQSHRAKAGTPTMGGLLILAAAARADAAVGGPVEPVRLDRPCWPTVGCGGVGFADDYLKMTRRSHHGLHPALQDGRADRRRPRRRRALLLMA